MYCVQTKRFTSLRSIFFLPFEDNNLSIFIDASLAHFLLFDVIRKHEKNRK